MARSRQVSQQRTLDAAIEMARKARGGEKIEGAFNKAKKEWMEILPITRKLLVMYFQDMTDDEWTTFWADLDVPA